MPRCLIRRPGSRPGAARPAGCLIRLRPGWVLGPSQQAEHTPHLALRYVPKFFCSVCLAAKHSMHRAKRCIHPGIPTSWMSSYISQECIACCRRIGSEVTPGRREQRSPSSFDQAGCPQPSTRPRYYIHIHQLAYASKDNDIFLLDRDTSGTPLLTRD